jgi:hypothetical protein
MSRAKIFLSKFNIPATLIARIRKFLIVGFSARRCAEFWGDDAPC